MTDEVVAAEAGANGAAFQAWAPKPAKPLARPRPEDSVTAYGLDGAAAGEAKGSGGEEQQASGRVDDHDT